MALESMRTVPVVKTAGAVSVACRCPACGKVPQYAGSVFCGSCGTDLRTVPELMFDSGAWLRGDGVEGARVLRLDDGREQETVFADLPPAGDDGERMFLDGSDRVVLFEDGPDGPRVSGCPLGYAGTCRGPDGRGCSDLVGWIGYDGASGPVVCGCVCRGMASF